MTSLNIQIVLDESDRVGPGKIRLLELIAEKGSISEAARSMGMSYRRAWLLIDSINTMFDTPVISTRVGGYGRGGATLTDFGQSVIDHYRQFESECRNLLASKHPVLAATTRHPRPNDA
ncbi:MAG TPA: winged helix-turn-helix domain-containing protein [Alphaproteobacteria bacterium]|nr:winged helix-turn-helix domain-containing protein [Alphaproteobacteria bacterium]